MRCLPRWLAHPDPPQSPQLHARVDALAERIDRAAEQINAAVADIRKTPRKDAAP